MHGDYVGVAFHKEAQVVADNGLFGQEESVEFFLFGIDGRFRGILVFDAYTFGGCVQHPSAESHDFAAQGVYGKDDPSAEPVIELAAVAFEAQAGREQVFFLVAFGFGRLCQCVPLCGAVAQLEFLDDVIPETARTEVGHADGAAVHCVAELVLEKTVGPFVDDEHALAFASCLFFFVGQFAFLDFDVVFLGQVAQGVREGQLLMFHDEMHGVAAFPAGKTFAKPF